MQILSDDVHEQRPVSTSRWSRLVHAGRLDTRIARAAIGEGLVRTTAGGRPKPAVRLLTPGNARRLADRIRRGVGAKTREKIAERLVVLTLTALFDRRFVQIDPDFANFPVPAR